MADARAAGLPEAGLTKATETTLAQRELTPEQLREFKAAFRVFDKNHDGTIDVNEISTVMRSLGQVVSQKEVMQMIVRTSRHRERTVLPAQHTRTHSVTRARKHTNTHMHAPSYLPPTHHTHPPRSGPACRSSAPLTCGGAVFGKLGGCRMPATRMATGRLISTSSQS